jgi:hypothetical protein
MATRKSKTTNAGARMATQNKPDTAPDAFEERVVAFATQLGEIAGNLQTKAEGWLDRENLSQQLTSARDSATDLLKQLAASVGSGSAQPAETAARRPAKGRSGGVVDAPGKKHRKPVQSLSQKTLARSQSDKARAVKAQINANRLRTRA